MIKLKKDGEYLMGYNENNVDCCYYPLTPEAKELDLPLLPNPFEGDVWVKGNRISVTTVYEYKEQQDWPNHNEYKNLGCQTYIGEVIEVGKGLALKTDESEIFKTQGTYWFGSILNQNCKLLEAAQPKQFSLEDVKKIAQAAFTVKSNNETLIQDFNKWFEKRIQSLSTQQLPVSFEPEYETPYSDGYTEDRIRRFYGKPELKTITNSEGKRELVGTWKFVE